MMYRDEAVPSFQEYAEAIMPFVKKTGCKLIIEPGRSIVGNAAVLITRVLYVKDNGLKHFTVVDAGMNDLLRPALYDSYHFIWPVKSGRIPPSHLFASSEAQEYCNREAVEMYDAHGKRDINADGLILTDVVGPICESSDCFAKSRRLPIMERGMNLAVFSAGAYGFSMSSNYNSRPRPAEVLVEGGEARVMRIRESYEDLMDGESM